MADWYYHQRGQQFGPVSEQQLAALVRNGSVQPTDLIWNASMPNWVQAATMPQFGAPTAAPAYAAPQQSYTPPQQMGYYGPDTAGMPSLSSRGMDLLRQTKPWVRFMAVMNFIGAAGLAIVGFILMAAGSHMRGPVGGAGAVVGVIYIGMGALLFVPGIYLNQYASYIGNLMASRSSMDLDSALQAQKSFWKFMGILMIVYLCFILLAIILSAGAASSGRYRY